MYSMMLLINATKANWAAPHSWHKYYFFWPLSP